MSRSSTAATCAARAAGWTWPPSRRSSRDRKSRRVLFRSRHKRRLKRGEFFPPFLYVSIINSCNLRCQGCWVDVAAKQEIIQRSEEQTCALPISAQAAAEAGRVLPSVPLCLDHQQLQPALPGLLGGRGRQAGDHPEIGRADVCSSDLGTSGG